MIPIENIESVPAEQIVAGRFLLSHTRYEKPLMLSCHDGNQLSTIAFAPRDDRGFEVMPLAGVRDSFLIAGTPTLLVDHRALISPRRTDIPFGAVCLVRGNAYFVASFGYGAALVGMDGSLIQEHDSDQIVAFAKWRLKLAGFNDEWIELHSEDLLL